jgi:hypothetical protein
MKDRMALGRGDNIENARRSSMYVGSHGVCGTVEEMTGNGHWGPHVSLSPFTVFHPLTCVHIVCATSPTLPPPGVHILKKLSMNSCWSVFQREP